MKKLFNFPFTSASSVIISPLSKIMMFRCKICKIIKILYTARIFYCLQIFLSPDYCSSFFSVF